MNLCLSKTLDNTDLPIAVKPRSRMGAQSGPLGFRHSTHQVIISEEGLAHKK